MEFIDTHAHIYLDDFAEDIDQLLAQAKKANVNHIFMPNIDSSTIKQIHNLEEKHPNSCHAMMGLHPCYVKENFKSELNIIESELKKRNYYAVGEIGIDLYWDKSTFDIQKEAFIKQIEWAKDLKIPVAIHSRDSLDHTIKIISELQDGNLSGVFHCYNGTVDQAKQIMDAGFYMGIGGVVTFKKAGVDKTVAEIPLESLILETDAPYLTPTPYRGKRNIPEYIPIIASKVAEVHGITLMEVANVTSENARNLFDFH